MRLIVEMEMNRYVQIVSRSLFEGKSEENDGELREMHITSR